MPMLRKAFLVLLLILGLAAGSLAAGMDLVVMVDTSASMFPYYDELVQYLLKDLLEHWLHKDDTFHLLSFADQAEVEISAKIEKPEDLTRIIERIYLLEPLGRYTDLIAALDYLYEYLSGLKRETPKLVLLLTDGVHDPPPDSPNRAGADQVLSRLLESADRIRLNGWEIHILQTPLMAIGSGQLSEAKLGELPKRPPAGAAGSEAQKPERPAPVGTQPEKEGAAKTAAPGSAGAAGPTSPEAPAEGEEDQGLLRAFADRAGATVLPYSQTTREGLTEQLTGFLTLRFPGHLGTVGRRFTAVFTLSNPGPKDATLKLAALRSGRMNLLARESSLLVPAGQTVDLRASVRLPLAAAPGDYELPVSVEFRDEGVRVSPLEGVLAFTFTATLLFGRVPLYVLFIVVAALVVLLVLWLAVLFRNRLRDRSFQRVFGAGRGGRRPLILKVSLQNSNIGTRNIHEVPPKSVRGVGGDGSAFLIYYRPMAANIGYVYNEGRQYTFIPKKLQYFPVLKEPLKDCLNREIRALSLRGHEVRFQFQEYVSPLESINFLMRSVKRQPPPFKAPAER
jgi:hypothetical protein